MKYNFSLFFFLICVVVNGQELSNIGSTPLFTVGGGVSVNQVYNWSDVHGTYSDPYAYTVAANLNLSLYGWSIPITGMYSNRKWSYQQPFNQFSINPSYKWIKLYIGYNSMSFSNYTLNGHRFFGGGVEVSVAPHWKISAMTGRMQERILPDSSSSIIPAYSRLGSGLKTEYTFETGNIAISSFYAKDNVRSLAGYDSLTISPAENLAISLSSNISLFDNLKLGVEYSTSLFTNDIRSEKMSDQYKIPFIKRTSTHQYNAIKSSINYNSFLGSVGLGYERVDPGYITLGAYNSVNDFVNYTFNYAGQIIPEKLNFATSIGLQKDDLANKQAQNNQRWVSSFNIGFIPVKAVNSNFSYGNFRNYTHVRSGFENINNTTPYAIADTLDFTQISEDMGLSISISPQGNETIKNSFIISTNIQQASQQQSDNQNHSNNRFYTTMLGYNQNRVKQNLSFSFNFNYNLNIADSIKTFTLGPSLSVRKMFLNKKLNTNLSTSYNQSRLNRTLQSEILIFRSGVGYSLQNHNFDFNAIWAIRNRHSQSKKTNDLTFTLTYRYNFKGFSYSPGKNTTDSKQND